MTANIISPYPYFTNANGTPLEGGHIYIGTAGLDPRTNPITVYQDEALTIPWSPIRTVGGYPAYQGAPSNFYTAATAYSIIVTTSTGAIAFRNLTARGLDPTLRADLASTTAGKGASLVETTAGNTVQDNLDNVVSVMSVIPTTEYAAIRNGTTTYNATAVIQAQIDALSAAGGGEIQFPKGTFLVGDLILKAGVILSGAGRFGYGYLASSATKKTILKMAAGATWVVDTVATTTRGIGVVGFDFLGLGAGTANGGIRFRAGNMWAKITNCSFNTFGEQAILNEGGVVSIQDILTINCVLNRTRTQLTGAVEDKGNDTYLLHVEAGPSLTAGEGENGVVNITDLPTFTGDISTASNVITNCSSVANVALGHVLKHPNIPVGARVIAISGLSITIDVTPTATTAGVTITPRRPDLYICGILLGGANSFCSDSNGEFAERGIHSTSRTNTVVGCRGDRNAGHGISGVGHFVGAKAGDNSWYGTGIWDNFNFNNTQQGQMTGGLAYKVGANAARYDLQCLGSYVVASRWLVTGFRPSYSATIAAVSNDILPHDICGPAFIGQNTGATTTGATPNVASLGMYVPSDASPITITNFLNGIPGQDLYVRGNANVTIQHNTNIILPGFVDMPLLANGLYHFKRDASAWRLVSRPFRSSAAIASPTGGATIDANARTAIDAIRAALTAAGITL